MDSTRERDPPCYSVHTKPLAKNLRKLSYMEKPSPDVARKSSAEIRSEIEQIAVPFSLLRQITEDYSSDRLVGEGGFAKV